MMRIIGIPSILVAVLLVALLSVSGPAQARTITFEDFKKIVGVSDAQISPDGTRIAYIVSHMNYDKDRYDRDLMMLSVPVGEQHKLSFERHGLASPRWSPDGQRLAFLAESGQGKKAQEQLFVLDLRGGDPVRLTSTKDGVEQFTWRPDSKAIAYVTPDEHRDEKLREKHHDFFKVGDQGYLSQEAPTSDHIWLIDANGSGNKRLTSGEWSLPSSQPPSSPASPLSWSPDGKYITFTKQATPFYGDTDQAVIALLDVQTGAIRQITSHRRLEGYSEYSPDGSKIAYWYPFNGDPAGQNDIFVTSSLGGDGQDITRDDIDTNVQRAIWLPDSKSLLISGHKGTDAAVWIKPLDGQAKRLQLSGVQPVQAFWLDASVNTGGAIAFTASEAHHPTELYYMKSPSAQPQRLTHYNDSIAALDLGKVQAIQWKGPDGFKEDGVLTFPPSYVAGKLYPLVLNIHGGPNSASITGFSAFSQVMAARGWIIFSPNYRGSDNIGETYWHGVVGDAGEGPGRDIMAGIDAVKALGVVDSNRIAVSGWSYGGLMTSWMIGHYHIWKAAVSGAAVNNFLDQYALSDGNVGWRFELGGEAPFTNKKTMASYTAQSPITYAGNVNTPTLIMSDTGDERVPITQSYEMFRALRDHHVTTKFYAYPVAGHFPADPVRSLDVYTRWVGWIAEYLK